jgi:hypothetical protein
MGLNHILKLCWFTRLEIASSINESKSDCIVGASRGEAPVEDEAAEPAPERVSNTQPADRFGDYNPDAKPVLASKSPSCFKRRFLKFERSRSRTGEHYHKDLKKLNDDMLVMNDTVTF